MSEVGGAHDGETVEATLLEAGILELTGDEIDDVHEDATEQAGDLHLDPSVAQAYRREYDRMANPNAEREQLHALLGTPVESTASRGDGQPFEAEETDDGFVLRRDGTTIGEWPSRTAFRIDLAFAGVHADRIDSWASASSAERGELLSGTRLFLESCPGCDGELSFRVSSLSTDDDDDADRDVALLACEHCDEALFVGDDAA